jgi:mono/diheme cytochrome c family protein
MKRILWIVLRVIAAILLLAGVFIGYACYNVRARMAKTYTVTVPTLDVTPGPELVERGRYLATHVVICADCHGKNLGGEAMSDDLIFARLYGANLTSGRGGIESRYSDADFVRVFLHGVRKDGHSVVFMPSQEVKLTARDMAAIIAYIRAQPPVDGVVPEPRPGLIASVLGATGKLPLLPAEYIDHDHVSFAPPDTSTDPATSGAHIVATAGCGGCHMPTFEGGGGPPPGAGNITPVGIGTWTEEDFKTALRTHKRPDGSKVADTMPLGLGGMSDEDLSKVFAFLKTLPPKGEKTKHQLHPE